MQITVRLFANLKGYAPVEGLAGTPFTLDLPDQACIADVVERLQLPHDLVKVTFVNGIIQPLDWKLSPGDQLGIFPPVAGGAA